MLCKQSVFMKYVEKTYSALRYATGTILLLCIGFICSTLSTQPTVEDKTKKDFEKITVSQTELGKKYLSKVSAGGNTFANRFHSPDRSVFSSLHFYTPEIDERDKIDLSITVWAQPHIWRVQLLDLGSYIPLTVHSFEITNKILSLLETVVLLN